MKKDENTFRDWSHFTKMKITERLKIKIQTENNIVN